MSLRGRVYVLLSTSSSYLSVISATGGYTFICIAWNVVVLSFVWIYLQPIVRFVHSIVGNSMSSTSDIHVALIWHGHSTTEAATLFASVYRWPCCCFRRRRCWFAISFTEERWFRGTYQRMCLLLLLIFAIIVIVAFSGFHGEGLVSIPSGNGN